MQIRSHLFPSSLKEAVEMLHAEGGKARLIAGGTDLILEIRDQTNEFEVLVDLGHIPGLDQIERKGELIHLGPLVTMAKAESSALLKQDAIALAEACSWVGGPQIRNRATLTGNIVSAQPAADGAIALLALDARLKILSRHGERTLMLAESYAGVGRSNVDPSAEVISGIELMAQHPGEVSAFRRITKRKALALPQLNCAAWMSRAENQCTGIRIALGPVAESPFRARQAEAYLLGKPLSLENLTACAVVACEEAQPRDSVLRGSGRYRKQIVAVIVRETLEQAANRLEGSQV
jgi:CO/xanthine dehydrogenase FAD-binding subunit